MRIRGAWRATAARTAPRAAAWVLATAAAWAAVLASGAARAASEDWPTVAGDYERSSRTTAEVRGRARPEWYVAFDAHIHPWTQPICVDGRIYVSTARGLYAIDGGDGSVLWVYPTELPLGNSPTVAGGTAYVGGLDRRLYAIDTATGRLKDGWTFDLAGAGFDANPVVADGRVFLPSRDGALYCFDAATGKILWTYEAGAEISYSPAYRDGVVYFAANDARAYAVRADGREVWKSEPLTGFAQFHNYWVVLAGESLVLAGYNNIMLNRVGYPQGTKLINFDVAGVGAGPLGPTQTEPGPWPEGTPTIDVQKAVDYFEARPENRTVFILDAATGRERTFDCDGDGTPDYAPFLWMGTHSGNRYPPAIAPDGVLYMPNHLDVRELGRARIVGWKWGTRYQCTPRVHNAVDEPYAYAIGGTVLYWSLCGGREGGAWDLADPTREATWGYYGYSLGDRLNGGTFQEGLAPGYNWAKVYGDDMNGWGVFGDVNGLYGYHGLQSPLVPHGGAVYKLQHNCLLKFSPHATACRRMPDATIAPPALPAPSFTREQLEAMLAGEIRKMLDAGPLAPGYYNAGHYLHQFWPYNAELFTFPQDTIVTLLAALPHVPEPMRGELEQYIRDEFAANPPWEVTRLGWQGRALREAYPLPPAAAAAAETTGPQRNWDWRPDYFYAVYRYAEAFGGARALLVRCQQRLNTQFRKPTDEQFIDRPQDLNAWIAGYVGYVGLARLAGVEVPAERAELERLMRLRAEHFTIDSPLEVPDIHEQPPQTSGFGVASPQYGPRGYAVARNFLHLTPELGAYLGEHAGGQVATAVARYEHVAPQWFVSKYHAGIGETATQFAVDQPALFGAKAWILRQPRGELGKYIDVPLCARGDLYYLQRLVQAIEAEAGEGTER